MPQAKSIGARKIRSSAIEWSRLTMCSHVSILLTLSMSQSAVYKWRNYLTFDVYNIAYIALSNAMIHTITNTTTILNL